MSRVSAVYPLAVFALLAAACSAAPGGSTPSGTNGGGGTTPVKTPPAGNGAAPDAGAAEGPQAVTQKGIITDFNTKKPVAGATVTAADQTTTTATDGSFSLTLQKGQPFALKVSANGYATLLEQQTSLAADYDAGRTTIVPNSLAQLLTAMLTGYDATLGVLSVAVIPTGTCASEDGSTLTVSPAGSAQVAYFSGGIPAASLTAVKGGEFPSAVIYNVQPGVPLTVTVNHATCKEAPFPFVQNGVDYTGEISTQSGQVTGFARIFLQ